MSVLYLITIDEIWTEVTVTGENTVDIIEHIRIKSIRVNV